ncbi:MAG: hypothetical protein ACKVXR_07470 [Planctomycetota bacterium]
MHRLGPTLFVLFLAVPVGAQSINVDFEPANTPYGRPTPNYGGSALKAGVWNSVGDVAVSGLLKWDGAVTGVSLTISDDSTGCGNGPTAFDFVANPGTSGQDEALLDDRYNPGGGFGSSFDFQGLAPGNYVVDTIIPKRACGGSSPHLVSVLGSPDPTVSVAATWNGAYVHGQNFARHGVTVTASGTLSVFVQQQHFADYIEVAGIQLHYGEQELPGHALCFGDVSAAAACPCTNTGLEGRGCQNSASTGGAVLFATGTTSPDTVVLRSSGERATSLSIFLQGNASINPVTYGDGLRCAGGTLKRLYTKTASAGEAFAPGPGDPSITARSAALGVPIPANGRRYYQVWYRDGNPGFCAPPTGDSFNVSSAVRILW